MDCYYDKDESDVFEFAIDDVLNEINYFNFNKGQKDRFKIYVRSNEQNYPHVHVVFKGNKPDCCVMLDRNKYFKHDDNISELDKEERELFNALINTKPPKLKGLSVYDRMCQEWNIKNPDFKMEIPENPPVYTQMTDSIVDKKNAMRK